MSVWQVYSFLNWNFEYKLYDKRKNHEYHHVRKKETESFERI